MNRMDVNKSNEANKVAEEIERVLSGEPNFWDVINHRVMVQADNMGYEPRWIMRNRVFKIKGDVRYIHIGFAGAVTMSITIDNRHNGVCKHTDVAVDIPPGLVDKVLKIKPDTYVEVRAKYIKLDTVVDRFILMEIIENKEELMFPYYVCNCDNPDKNSYSEDCYYNLGFEDTNIGNSCPMCGSTTKPIYNVYSEDFAKYIGRR